MTPDASFKKSVRDHAFNRAFVARLLLLKLKLKAYVRRQQQWRLFFLALRSIWWLGPWRGALIRYHQRRTRNTPLSRSASSPFGELDVAATVEHLNRAGVALGLQLTPEQVDHILDFCAERESEMRSEPHLHCPTINEIAHDPVVLAVVTQYLGAEPAYFRTDLYWSRAAPDANPIAPPGASGKPFHYDVGDFKSLVVFFYLTDVDVNSAPHLIIEGTHQVKRLRQLLTRHLSEEAARRQFGDRIRVVTGPRGMGFFEDVSCYHQRAAGQRDRLVMTITYLLQRTPDQRPESLT